MQTRKNDRQKEKGSERVSETEKERSQEGEKQFHMQTFLSLHDNGEHLFSIPFKCMMKTMFVKSDKKIILLLNWVTDLSQLKC